MSEETVQPTEQPPQPEPPKDRPIWLVGNISHQTETGSIVEGYEGYAEWSESSQDWLGCDKLSIRLYLESTWHVHSWMELSERAATCPDNETDTVLNIYYWDTQGRREEGTVGFFVCTKLYFSPDFHRLWERTDGPFPTRAVAVSAANLVFSLLSVHPTAEDFAAADAAIKPLVGSQFPTQTSAGWEEDY